MLPPKFTMGDVVKATCARAVQKQALDAIKANGVLVGMNMMSAEGVRFINQGLQMIVDYWDRKIAAGGEELSGALKRYCESCAADDREAAWEDDD